MSEKDVEIMKREATDEEFANTLKGLANEEFVNTLKDITKEEVPDVEKFKGTLDELQQRLANIRAAVKQERRRHALSQAIEEVDLLNKILLNVSVVMGDASSAARSRTVISKVLKAYEVLLDREFPEGKESSE